MTESDGTDRREGDRTEGVRQMNLMLRSHVKKTEKHQMNIKCLYF